MRKQEALVLPETCTFTRTSLTIAETTTSDAWEAIGMTLRTIEGTIQFWIGDWLRFGERMKYIPRAKYDQAQELTGLRRGTLKVYASVAKKVDPLVRLSDLGFQHHQLVARLPEKRQKIWLDRAVSEKMSVRDLRSAMSRPKRRSTDTREGTLEMLKEKLRGVIRNYEEWAELDGVRKAIEAL